MADIIIFPGNRRVGVIRRHGRLLSSYSADGAERTLAAFLRKQAAWLSKVAKPEDVDREIAHLEREIRAEICRLTGARRA